MPNPPIRTITLGIEEAHPLTSANIQAATEILQKASSRFTEAGYEVQTVRISTRPIFGDLVDWSALALLKYVQEVQHMLDDVGVSFCSLGTAQTMRSGFPLERIEEIADWLAATSALNATVQLATREGLQHAAALPTARVIQRLAQETAEGFGNFRFAALACVEPGSPFFPSAYHSGPASLSIGLQGAGIVADALRALRERTGSPLDLQQASGAVRMALLGHAIALNSVAEEVAQANGLQYRGIDLSPAPLGEDSIVAAMELCGYGLFGEPGTLAVATALTAAIKIPFSLMDTCGYCGLMLPVLEDAALGRRWEEGRVNAQQLLLYSAVCGIGLDTIPLAGDTPLAEIAHLLLDVGMLAARLQKPLSARLFPVPGKRAGERTTFTSPYLTNTVVR